MNTTKLKNYAPQARIDFIQAMTNRAAAYGLTKNRIEPVTVQGDFTLIGGQPHPKRVAAQRRALEKRVHDLGFDGAMEDAAYTWFNRLVALRYMELHGYLDHGFRVLSHPDPARNVPEILEQAEHLRLPGLNAAKVIELKLAGNKDAELYRILLIAQCNALHKAMPFLFESIDDGTELLLPDNLLHSDSLVRKLLREIPEGDWEQIEVIGWIYQFYISEKKNQVIGKVVNSEDIPAATQLFTPHWIVKYLVQNSIGRQWLETYPNSPLRHGMEYYIEPAEQTPEVRAQLKVITPESLNPEEMTMLDPACGSGHILVEAYDLFKAIYQERGYPAKDIARLILHNNLFGLEIDERAAQLASFALIMKARADDRRVLEGGIRMNVRCIQSSDGINAEELYEALTGVDVVDKSGIPPAEEFTFAEEITSPLFAYIRRESSTSSGPQPPPRISPFCLSDIRTILGLFKGDDAKTFGSLIRIPERLTKKLRRIVERADEVIQGDDLTRKSIAERFRPIAEQAWILGKAYDAVVANPPYMGTKVMPRQLKQWVQREYPRGRADLFSCFMSRSLELLGQHGIASLVTLQNWMFLTSFEELRKTLLLEHTVVSLVQIGFNSFPELNSKISLACMFSIHKTYFRDFSSTFLNCNDAPFAADKRAVFEECLANKKVFCRPMEDFFVIPGAPVAYWISDKILDIFRKERSLRTVADPRQGMSTTDNETFLRIWSEIDFTEIEFGSRESSKYWFPYNKGGEYRRWYGNGNSVVKYTRGGEDLIQLIRKKYPRIQGPDFIIKNQSYYFREGVTWTDISLMISARWLPKGHIFDSAGPVAFFDDMEKQSFVLAFLNSSLCAYFRQVLNPSLHFTLGDFANLPYPEFARESWDKAIVEQCIELCRKDWSSAETSWEFEKLPLLEFCSREPTIAASFNRREEECLLSRARLKDLEERNNRTFIETYGLDEELASTVQEEHLSVCCPSMIGESKALLSYCIGCTMGRFSLDEPGLVYAHARNEGFDITRYETFPADGDGIVPVLDYDWFEDDATNRFVEFINVSWPTEYLEENLEFVAKSLGLKKDESARDTVRRYFATGFFKDHLQTYKRRPIYWMFSSGKQRAFQCLVYLHRYNEGTLARMRTEYVIPLQGKLAARIDHLAGDIEKAGSTSHRKKLEKERDGLLKQQAELFTFGEKLRHYADKKIRLDLDDGVKVNYGKFGDLLAEVKAVTGGSAEED